MQDVPGTQGYANAIPRFVEATSIIPFEVLHHEFLEFLPAEAALVLDLGAGSGRDADTLSQIGYRVIAVEPLAEFRALGQELYPSSNIEWMNDALPTLQKLKYYSRQVDFILCSGVWHHLDPEEQQAAMKRVAELVKPRGIFCLSLRHGPAGVGHHVFPIDLSQTRRSADEAGFDILRETDHQPSLLANKPTVHWSRLVLQRRGLHIIFGGKRNQSRAH
ncbi:MAG: class I SAM-dependent methyltransferase [Bacteroidota bacterium]